MSNTDMSNTNMSDANISQPSPLTSDDPVARYLATKASTAQQTDCAALSQWMSDITGAPAQMWGPSIVGFGRYRYIYDSGRSGETFLTGFAIRGRELVIYLGIEPHAERLAQLGPHRVGKACLYLKSFANINLPALRELIRDSVQALQVRYPD